MYKKVPVPTYRYLPNGTYLLIYRFCLLLQGQPFSYKDVDMGFNTGDPLLDEAGKILRLLYITDLRYGSVPTIGIFVFMCLQSF